jgi:hypothetical protein
MAEKNPDDPMVELPIEVYCMICDKVLTTSVVRWPQSHIDRMKNIPEWQGVVRSGSYCEDHKPTKPQSV